MSDVPDIKSSRWATQDFRNDAFNAQIERLTWRLRYCQKTINWLSFSVLLMSILDLLRWLNGKS